MTSRSSHSWWNRGVATVFAISLFLSSLFAQAQEASTPPVGVLTIDLPGQSDVSISLPFHRATAFRGLVDSHSGNVITVQGEPGWMDDQFVFDDEVLISPETQTNTYYLLVCSGDSNGLEAMITDNDGGSITIEAIGSTLANGTVVEIIPYWSLETLFVNNQGIVPYPDVRGIGDGSSVYLYDPSEVGKDKAASEIFYYFDDGNGNSGWRKKGSRSDYNIVRDFQVIDHSSYLVIRNRMANSQQLVLSGDVRRAPQIIKISVLEEGVIQDNCIAVISALPMSLIESGLYQSGVIDPLTNPRRPNGDRLFVYDNESIGFDKAASEIYYYYDGESNGGPGWRKSGSSSEISIIRDNDIVFEPGKGYLIRKNNPGEVDSNDWIMSPSYLYSIN